VEGVGEAKSARRVEPRGAFARGCKAEVQQESLVLHGGSQMIISAQAIVMGRLLPQAHCASIDPLTFELSLTPAEPGWTVCKFAFAINRDQLHVVVNFSHEEDVDRGHAVAKMRRTVRTLVEWFLSGQTLFSESTLGFGPEQTVAKYADQEQWISHSDPGPDTEQTPQLPTTDDVYKGGTILPLIAKDALMLYALQDYATAVANPEFSLFLLWRAVEWILWEYDKSGKGRSPAYEPTEKALSLPPLWLHEVGTLAHNFARHARNRTRPESALVEAAKGRVKALILRHLRVTYDYPDGKVPSLVQDALSGWKQSE